MNEKEAREAWIADLARSGLTLDDVKPFGWKLWSPKKTAKQFPKAGEVWSYEIPYPQHRRKGLASLYRIRVLERTPGPFGTTIKTPKYWQPAGSQPGAYFPVHQDLEAAIDGGGQILIVEGEKKSLKATLEGFPCIGIGGVWSWRSARAGQGLIPELSGIDWKARQVAICFDSDATTNLDVMRAILALAEELTIRGALVSIATIPELDNGQKAGLDDFLVARGKAAFQLHLDASEVGDLSVKLWEMNQKFVAIKHPAIVLDENTTDAYNRPITKMVPVDKFRFVAANVVATERIVNADGQAKVKRVQVVDKWIEWPCRREFDSLTYEPGGPKILNHGSRYNAWSGLGIEPKRGDITPWRQLLDNLFKGAPREHRVWFERWCGWPLKHLGCKMNSAVGMWGPPGRGKSVLAEKILAPIYGSNFVSISQDQLDGDFNEWAENRQFVLVDEVNASESHARADRFKKLITQTDIQVSRKFVSLYSIPDHTNYFMTSNSPRAFYVEDNDRRFFIHRVSDEQLPPAFFDNLIDGWIGFRNAPNYGPGPAALLHYFRYELDYGNFDPMAPPPVTEDKLDMIEASRPPVEDWLRQFPGSELWKVRGGREVYELGELCSLYQAGDLSKHRMAPNSFGAHVRNVGMLKRKVKDGPRTVRLVVVSSPDVWRPKNAAAWLAELRRAPQERKF